MRLTYLKDKGIEVEEMGDFEEDTFTKTSIYSLRKSDNVTKSLVVIEPQAWKDSGAKKLARPRVYLELGEALSIGVKALGFCKEISQAEQIDIEAIEHIINAEKVINNILKNVFNATIEEPEIV